MYNRFVLNETSYHGAGAVKAVAEEITARGFKKAFVASDPDLIKFGVSKKVTDVLDDAGIAYEMFSEIKPNPTIQNVQSGVEAFKASGADCIVAIGGGSSMDTAKAIGIIIKNPEFADVRSLEGVAPTKNKCVPIIAVPTTAVIPLSSNSGLICISRRSWPGYFRYIITFFSVPVYAENITEYLLYSLSVMSRQRMRIANLFLSICDQPCLYVAKNSFIFFIALSSWRISGR